MLTMYNSINFIGEFNENFKDFKSMDHCTYGGALDLPNGEKPKICSVDHGDDIGVDIIVSGDGANSTLISINPVDEHSYLLSIPGYTASHKAIAVSMLSYFNDYEVASEAIEAIVSDYGMERI